MHRICCLLILFISGSVQVEVEATVEKKNIEWLKYLKVKVSVDVSLSNEYKSSVKTQEELENIEHAVDESTFAIIKLRKPIVPDEFRSSSEEPMMTATTIERAATTGGGVLLEGQYEKQKQSALKADAVSISSSADSTTGTIKEQVAKGTQETTTATSSSFTMTTPVESTTSPLLYYAVLDETGRVGPNFEVIEEKMQIEKIDYTNHNKIVAQINTALLEREVMVIDTSLYNETELRERLTNMSNLEELAGERHRDLGSSFILPVLASCNYDNNSAPLVYTDIPVNVAVQLNILYLASFDSSLMEYTTDMEMQLSWFDLRLANNYTQPIRIREKEIMDKIWRPDPYFVNSKFSHFHKVSFPNFRMRVMPSGLVTYTMRVSSVCNCFMTFCLYPHDRQVCDIKISSIAYPSSFVRFHWHSQPVHFQSRIALPELHMRRLYTEQCVVEGKLLSSSCLRLVFDLERDGGRAVVEKYIPSTLAMMFAWVAPYVPYNYEDVRIVTPITVLLTLVQMEKGDQKIRTSYLTSIDIWFAAMKMFTVLSLVESLTVLALIKRSRATEKSAVRAMNEFERLKCKSEAYRLRQLYHRLDSISRFMSPLGFVLFFVYYVLFIAQGDESGCLRKQQISLSNTFF